MATSAKYFLGSASIFVLIICNALQVKAFECGTTDYTNPLITKGMVTERGEWPFLTALYLAQEFKFFCAGSIISAQHVLTAAHCIQEKSNFFGLQPVNVVVLLGAYNLKLGNESDVQQRNVSEIYLHPDWDVWDDKYDADLAILLLNEIVSFTDFIRPVCMPGDNSTINNAKGSVVGWGLTQIGTSLNLESIKHATTTTLNDSYCYTEDDVVAAMSTLRTFCSRGLDGNPNNGDSGGGFYVLYGSAWVQYGILSAMRSNASGFVDANTISIYTNVMEFKDWISEIVNKSGETVGVAEIVVEVVLSCRYGTMDTYKKYGCRVNDLNIQSGNHAVTSFTGYHIFLQTNKNVEIITFDSGTMFSLPFGIGRIFKNLKILEVQKRLKTRRIMRANFKNMVNLVHLWIEKNDIETLQYDCLRDLPNLEVFALLYNKIQHIHERTFETNTKLKQVHLYHNKLKILPAKIFRNNLLLEIVNLAGNSITTVDEMIFELHSNLKQVYLSANQLTVLPPNLFRKNLLLEIVYLNYNSLNTIDETIFVNNTNLRDVHLSVNVLESFTRTLFQNNLLLEHVYFANSYLKSIDEKSFETNHKLKTVALDRNLLTLLPGNLFQNNFLLEIVNLGDNSLTTIDERIFETNTELRQVFLDSNPLKALPRNLFRNNLLLKIVYLQNNSLNVIDETIFESNAKLKQVNLSGNKLEILPRNLFQNNLLLESVNFEDNFLKIIEINFAILPNIKEIVFKNNVCIDDVFYRDYIPKNNLTRIQRMVHVNCTSLNAV